MIIDVSLNNATFPEVASYTYETTWNHRTFRMAPAASRSVVAKPRGTVGRGTLPEHQQILCLPLVASLPTEWVERAQG